MHMIRHDDELIHEYVREVFRYLGPGLADSGGSRRLSEDGTLLVRADGDEIVTCRGIVVIGQTDRPPASF